jgi:hypothetical protein
MEIESSLDKKDQNIKADLSKVDQESTKFGPESSMNERRE